MGRAHPTNFGSLKNELVEHEDYKIKVEAKQSLFQYIEVFYNRQRRHSYLGYVSPAEFERASGPLIKVYVKLWQPQNPLTFVNNDEHQN